MSTFNFYNLNDNVNSSKLQDKYETVEQRLIEIRKGLVAAQKQLQKLTQHDSISNKKAAKKKFYEEAVEVLKKREQKCLYGLSMIVPSYNIVSLYQQIFQQNQSLVHKADALPTVAMRKK